MTLDIYYSRDKILTSTPSIRVDATVGSSRLPYFKLKEYNVSGLTAFAFENGLVFDGNHVTVLTNMLIPGYFANSGGTDIHGLCLAQLGLPPDAKAFVEDILSLGRFGCPKRLVMSDPATKDHFKFNRMRFYPFIMTDYNIGYYVCDEGNPQHHWPDYNPAEKGVALDYPVAYEPTLGILMTRAAHIEY
jgi:hypothetical protein